MEEYAQHLYQMCKKREKLTYTEMYREALEILHEKEIDEKLRRDLLIEMFRYSYYESVNLAPDPRVDVANRVEAPYAIIHDFKDGKLSNATLKRVRESVDEMRRRIDTPTEIIDDDNWAKTVIF